MKEKFPRLRGALRRLRAGWHRLAPRPLGAKVRWSLTVGLLLLATLALCFTCLLLGTIDFSQKRIDFYLSDGCILVLNALPVFVLVALLYALTNRAWAAFLLSAVPLLLLLYINYFKIVLRSEPFVADDLSAVGEGAGIMGNYRIVPPTSMYLCIAGVVVLTVLLARYGRGRVPKRVWYVRPLGAARGTGTIRTTTSTAPRRSRATTSAPSATGATKRPSARRATSGRFCTPCPT